MTGHPRTAPFFLGMASAVVLEAGLGLLVYVSPGLLPALTVVLAVALGSLGLGLALGPPRPWRPTGARWRWFLALGSLLAAAVLSIGWTFQGGVPESGWERGLQLTSLVALPLYGLGACLASVADPAHALGSVVVALLGGMAGVVVMGLVLVPRLEPASVYIFCILCLSVAALSRRTA